MKVPLKNSAPLRFGIVGSINTALDFGLLFILKSLGLPVITANILSSTCAFGFSFLANKKYTFKAKGGDVRREILLFIIVTLFGLWVLQSIVIQVILWLFTPAQGHESLLLVIAKLLATVVSLTWNYLLYSKVVFKQKNLPPRDTSPSREQ